MKSGCPTGASSILMFADSGGAVIRSQGPSSSLTPAIVPTTSQTASTGASRSDVNASV